LKFADIIPFYAVDLQINSKLKYFILRTF